MKDRYPNSINVHYLTAREWPQTNIPGTKEWTPARPISYPGFLGRIRLAWEVFLGRADALYWDKPGTVDGKWKDARWEEHFEDGDFKTDTNWHN